MRWVFRWLAALVGCHCPAFVLRDDPTRCDLCGLPPERHPVWKANR